MDNLNLNVLIKKYLRYGQLQKRLSEHTIKAYRIDLIQFASFFEASNKMPDKEEVLTYLAFLHTSYKVKTVKRKIASIKAFFNYLEEEELLYSNPFSKCRIKLHEPFMLPRTIPLSTIKILLQCVYRQKEQLKNDLTQYKFCLRDIAVLELLFATGMRVSELCSLAADAVDLDDCTVMIYGKGSKERMIQIGNASVITALTEYYRCFSFDIFKSGCFFVNRLGNQLSDQSVRLMIKKYSDMAGISQHITLHMFRHSFATLLLEEDVDIRYVQQILGHSSITTTQIYTHVTTKKQRDILTTKHPRNKLIIG